jgi:hypothetical protein
LEYKFERKKVEKIKMGYSIKNGYKLLWKAVGVKIEEF